jgi:hypothetical protein
MPVTTLARQSQQYVVVVANGEQALTTYFRKWLLGVVVHGYTNPLFGPADQLAWMARMATDLHDECGFDQTIAFDWTKNSGAQHSGETIAAGNSLYSAIVPVANSLTQHPGNVVDLHFIGHSRGTVVVSQALQHFVQRTDLRLLGSYVEVTLLDIHPANAIEDGLLDYVNNLAGLGLYAFVYPFQAAAQDPEVLLPAGANIMSIDIWYQLTRCANFTSTNKYQENILNLWGESPDSNHIINTSRVQPTWKNLTNLKDELIGEIGHSEIHEYYRQYEVDLEP